MSEKEALKSANQSRNDALDKLANEDVTTTGDDTQESLEVGRREESATPALRRDTTGLDLADSVVLDLEESFEDGEFPMGGRSADNSSYHLSQIKPRSRSRQSSIVGRNDPPIRPSSRSGMTPLVSSSFNIGAFRRRAREPSILGTGRKTQADTTTTTAQDHGSDSESEGDFAPEAESTPVNNRRRTRHSVRQDEEVEASPAVQEAPSSRKRKSDVGPADDDEARPSKVPRSQGSASAQDSDSDSELSSLPSPEAMARAIERPVTPTNLYNEEDVASPVSSAIEGQEAWPDIRNLAKRRRRPSVTDPAQLETLSNVSSPPSLTHSPNYEGRARRGRPRHQHHQSPTTADLASLLPKRRHQRMRSPADEESDEELDADGLGQDDDELSYLDASRRRRGQKSRSVSRAAATRNARRPQSALGEKDAPATNTRRASSRHGKTYSRRASDKENQSGDEDEDDENEPSRFEPMPEDSFAGETGDASAVSASNELNQAKAKFKEVDRWELEFEEDEEPPSPVGAR